MPLARYHKLDPVKRDTIIDAAAGKAVRFYQVELELINLESNEKVWIGQKKLKKLVKNPKFRM